MEELGKFLIEIFKDILESIGINWLQEHDKVESVLGGIMIVVVGLYVSFYVGAFLYFLAKRIFKKKK